MDMVVRLAATCVLSLVLCSCGGGRDSPQHSDATARISLRIAAEPVEWVDEVVLQIRGVAFISRQGKRETYYKPEHVTQAQLISAGPVGSTVFPEIVLPADEYWMVRIELDAVDNVSDSYVRSLRGEECELRTASSGVIAYGQIDLREGQEESLTVVADLRRTLHPADCVAGYSLRSSYDLVDDQKTGWIEGSVDPSLVPADCEPKVYAFLEGEIVDDVADVIPAHDSPLSVATVEMQRGVYRYRTRPLLPLFMREDLPLDNSPLCQLATMCLRPASYVLAFTCDADDPVADDDVGFGPFAALILQGGVANELNFEATREEVP